MSLARINEERGRFCGGGGTIEEELATVVAQVNYLKYFC